jgi:acetolactate synthase I/II/III large subunit
LKEFAMKMNGAQIICESLTREGVEVIYGVIGASTLPLYDTFDQYPQLHHVMVRHEQGAAHAAEGYARITGKVGVCLATSGPGATNLVTGIADAYLDSVPIVAITGQVARASIGRDAFQEVDITGITLPITKHNYLVRDVKDLASTFKEAFYIARTGRPGPVLIDIPRDLLVEQIEAVFPAETDLPGYNPTFQGHGNQIRKAAELINKAQRPLIISGHGVTISNAFAEIAALADKANIPVITTLLGVSSFPRTHALSFGMLGMHGLACANKATSQADCVIAVGTRFSDRVTARLNAFAPKANIIHIDVDPAEIGKNTRAEVPIVGDARSVLAELNNQVSASDHEEWLAQLRTWRDRQPAAVNDNNKALLPRYVIEQLHRGTNGEATIVTGVGQHQLWAAQYYPYERPNSLITSGGLGTMGFALPAAMGVKMGRPDLPVWVVDGDGSFQMTLHELATIVQEGLEIKIAIINNSFLGMVRQWQELFYGKRYVATPLSSPNYVTLARAYGIPGLRVTQMAEVLPAIREAAGTPGSFLIEFMVDTEEKVYPMVPPGASLAEFIEAGGKT